MQFLRKVTSQPKYAIGAEATAEFRRKLSGAILGRSGKEEKSDLLFVTWGWFQWLKGNLELGRTRL